MFHLCSAFMSYLLLYPSIKTISQQISVNECMNQSIHGEKKAAFLLGHIYFAILGNIVNTGRRLVYARVFTHTSMTIWRHTRFGVWGGWQADFEKAMQITLLISHISENHLSKVLKGSTALTQYSNKSELFTDSLLASVASPFLSAGQDLMILTNLLKLSVQIYV